MSTALANFLFEAANFILLAGALAWLLFRPVRAALEREREQYAAELAQAAQSRAEAETLAREARELRERAEQEAESRRAEILAAAREEAARLAEQGRQEHAAQRRQLEQELEAARLRQVHALADALGRVAAASVRELLLALDGPALDLALVRAACGQLRTLPSERLGGAMVEAARPLDSEARGLLGDVLGAGFAERTVAELGAGVRVTTGGGQVDVSAAAVARQAAQELASRLADEPAQLGGAHG